MGIGFQLLYSDLQFFSLFHEETFLGSDGGIWSVLSGAKGTVLTLQYVPLLSLIDQSLQAITQSSVFDLKNVFLNIGSGALSLLLLYFYNYCTKQTKV